MAKSRDELIAEGYCDSRGVIAGATVVSLPNFDSKYRGVLLFVKDNYLNIYKTDLRGNIFQRVASVEIVKLENFVLKIGLLSQFLSFDYEGQHYEFTNVSALKLLKKVFEEERSKYGAS